VQATPPPFFKRGPSPFVRLLVFGLLALALIALDARYRYLEPVRQAVSIVVYPLQQIAAAPVAVATRIGEFFVTSSKLRDENVRLARDKLENAAATHELAALRSENAELRGLLGARQTLASTAVTAEVLYGARDPFAQKIIVDRGSTNEVKAGLPVVDELGVIGQVTRVYPFVSEVTLITDKDHAVPVRNVRSGLRAIVFGNGRDGSLDLRFMPVNADIQTGDLLVTSGIDGTYPAGLPVARVVNIERNAALAFARITCAPLAGVQSRDHVLVLTSVREQPQRPADAEPEPKRRKGRKGAS
jgi:rod shape-determining protein MreC